MVVVVVVRTMTVAVAVTVWWCCWFHRLVGWSVVGWGYLPLALAFVTPRATSTHSRGLRAGADASVGSRKGVGAADGTLPPPLPMRDSRAPTTTVTHDAGAYVKYTCSGRNKEGEGRRNERCMGKEGCDVSVSVSVGVSVEE
jgi:hypothetical protein